ncbi:hypothetical protein CHS0354_036378 [Potamilus streckersoni]|uniref:[histone H3]-dimethyl-L-lysine(36) demethylase n=1 Tax=Potamilus streckersoni TaxID=2493646 RepID=A0AAE0W3Q3_9BIVA|nr:hypothetical protein CHS0354_036378 [Potamilus streckersoni]
MENKQDNSEQGRKLRVKERKTYTDEDIDDDEIDGKRNYSVDEKLKSNKYNKNYVKFMKGEDFTLKYLQENGLKYPILFLEKSGLGLRVPSQNFQVSDVKQCVGSRRMLDVMDVTTQKGMEMSMKEWVRYYENKDRDRLLNVISLEFSHTKLENYVDSPSLVRQVDWVDVAWPQHLKECQTEATNIIEKMKYPKVQKYCLMSVAGCYTDFHIDFGGTSVWYHILHGEKVFWLIPPTVRNQEIYENWVLSGKQGDTFLADHIQDCQKIELKAGNTFIIPSGWIHAVYTPKDSLVFGGNFLHSFNIDQQLSVSAIEDITHVPGKFRYPFYTEISWYVLERYVHCLTGKTYLEKPQLKLEETEKADSPLPCPSERESNASSSPPDDVKAEDIKKETIELAPSTPKLSKTVSIELRRIDESSVRRSSSDDNDSVASGQPKSPSAALKFRSRKSSSDSVCSNTDVKSSALTELSDLAGRLDVNSEEESTLIKSEGDVKQSVSLDKPVKKKKYIHLTKYEILGLTRLAEWLESLPSSKKGIPKDLLDPEAVMVQIKKLLDIHKNDDPVLAVTGEPVLVWSPDTKKFLKMKQKDKLSMGTGMKIKNAKGDKAGASSIRRRRTRCKKCEPCTRTDCGECNFCKDMKKYGGPGRMKQSCISRQCLAPVIPSAAVCMICGEDQRVKDELGESVTTLMECGICWEIVHLNCLRQKYENLDNEGVINEDLPNSWECPKCCYDGKQGQLKPRVLKGIPKSLRPAEGYSVSSPSYDTHDQVVEGKRVTAKQSPEHKIKDFSVGKDRSPFKASSPEIQVDSPMKTESDHHSPEETPKKRKPGRPPLHAKTSPHKPLQSIKSRQFSPQKTAAAIKKRRLSMKKSTQKIPLALPKTGSPSPKSNGQTSKKSSVPIITRAGRKRKAKPVIDSESDSSEDELLLRRRPRRELSPFDPEQPSTSRAHAEDSVGRASPRAHRTKQGFDSAQSVAGIRLARGARLGRKVMHEQNSPLTTSDANTNNSVEAEGGANQAKKSESECSGVFSKHGIDNFNASKRREDKSQEQLLTKEPRIVLQKYVVRPALPPPSPDYVELNNGKNHPLSREHWMRVFKFLTQVDLAKCLCVCKTWNRWCIHPGLWKTLDLSKRRIVEVHLMGIVRRQPLTLNLSSVVMTQKQLDWLVTRIPQLKHLDVSKCSWATISALCSSTCPLLHSLNMNWASSLKDQFFEDLVTLPVDRRPALKNISRLSQLTKLGVAGTEITDISLRLMTEYLPKLQEVDVSYCIRVTDEGINILTKSTLHSNLIALDLSGCRQLTGNSLHMIKRCTKLEKLSIKGCSKITIQNCQQFSLKTLKSMTW